MGNEYNMQGFELISLAGSNYCLKQIHIENHREDSAFAGKLF